MSWRDTAPGNPLVVAATALWWDATRQRRLVLQHCRLCNRVQHYPRTVCLGCKGTDLDFTPASGRGMVHSYSVVHRSPDPEDYPPPYTVALVRLEEGPILFTRLVHIEDPRCEMPVTVDWWPLDDGRNLPVFTTPVKAPIQEEEEEASWTSS